MTGGPGTGPDDSRRPGIARRLIVLGTCVVLVAAGLVSWLVVGSSGSSGAAGPPSADTGVVLDRALPPAIADLALEDQEGHRVTLADERGKVVFLSPFLTSCQEECPVVTGAMLDMQRQLDADGLSGRAVLVEATVDPGRDSPERMAAFARLSGSTWPLLTGSPPAIAELWKYFGVFIQKVPEDSPPGIDWQSGQPYTYDINHTDGFVLIDPSGHERFVAGGMVKVSAIPDKLHRLLDDEGWSNLRHPGGGAWTVGDALDGIGWLLGRPVPRSS